MIKQQGEVKVIKVDALPNNLSQHIAELDASGNQIISHSEKGHHHVVPGEIDLLEPPAEQVPSGMRVIYAVVKSAAELSQTAAQSHDQIELEPGYYAFRIQREFNPFLQESRIVND